MSESIQELREQRKFKATAARKLMDSTPADKWTDSSQTEYNGLMAAIDGVDSQIGNHEKLMQVEASNKQRIDNEAEKNGISTDHAEARVGAQKQVFSAYLRGGISAAHSLQEKFASKGVDIRAAMSTTTDAEGGYTVPTGFSGQLLEELKSFGGMRSVATVMRTASGAGIEWPTVDATAQEGELVGENATVTSLDATFGVKSLGAYKYSSKDIAVPFELLQDSEIDIEGYIRRLLAERIARVTNRHFTVGTGTGQPNGVGIAASLGATGAAGQASSVIYDDLVNLIHSVDPAYRDSASCSLMFHDSTMKALKKLKDADGRPLWVPGVAMGEPDTILGYRYSVNQALPEMAAGAKSILFGDFSKYIIRDVNDVTLFRMTDSAYTRKGQVGFLAFSRHDGDLMDAAGNSIKHYANAAV